MLRKSGFAVVALAGMLSAFAPTKAAAHDWDDDWGYRHHESERWRRHREHEWREHERRENAWRRHEWRERERRNYYYNDSAPYGNSYYQNQGGYYDNYGNFHPYNSNPYGY